MYGAADTFTAKKIIFMFKKHIYSNTRYFSLHTYKSIKESEMAEISFHMQELFITETRY